MRVASAAFLGRLLNSRHVFRAYAALGRHHDRADRDDSDARNTPIACRDALPELN